MNFFEELAGDVGSERGFALRHRVKDCDSELGATPNGRTVPEANSFRGVTIQ
jgi:hypothetical protein